VGGYVEDRAAFMAALRAVEIAGGPRGRVKMDPYGNPTQSIYVRKVEKVNGKRRTRSSTPIRMSASSASTTPRSS